MNTLPATCHRYGAAVIRVTALFGAGFEVVHHPQYYGSDPAFSGPATRLDRSRPLVDHSGTEIPELITAI